MWVAQLPNNLPVVVAHLDVYPRVHLQGLKQVMKISTDVLCPMGMRPPQVTLQYNVGPRKIRLISMQPHDINHSFH